MDVALGHSSDMAGFRDPQGEHQRQARLEGLAIEHLAPTALLVVTVRPPPATPLTGFEETTRR